MFSFLKAKGRKESPRKGVFNVVDVAPEIADSLDYHIKELIPEGISKIECRFQGVTPLFVAIIHSKTRRTFAIKGNSEFLDEEDYKEMGFNFEKYEKISDSIACVYSTYVYAMSDITKEEFEENFKIGKKELEELRKHYNYYSADFVIEW